MDRCILSNSAHQSAPRPGEDDTARRPRLHAAWEWLHHRRERIRKRPALNAWYRIFLGFFGSLVLIAGLLMVPYPGPGWLVVFAGLGILATEFHWARRVNEFAGRYYHRWTRWLGRQHVSVKLAVLAGTCLVVLCTLWLLGLIGTISGWLGIDWDWLRSPLSRG